MNTLSVGAALDLLTVGAGAHVGARSISCHHVPRSGVMVVAPVVVGARATVGPQSIVLPGAIVGEATVVGACCVVERAIPPHTFWAGRPLQQVPTDPLEGVTFVRPASEQRVGAPLDCAVGSSATLSEVLPRRRISEARAKLVALRPLLSLMLATSLIIASLGGAVFGTLAYFPRAWLTVVSWDSWGLALLIVASLVLVWEIGMLVLGLLLKWLLVGKRKPGVHPQRYPLREAACGTYFSILADLIGSGCILAPPLMTSLYLRLCGSVTGRRIIVSDPLRKAAQADLLHLGDASFLQGSTSLRLQLPVRGEIALQYPVKTSIFKLGKARRATQRWAKREFLLSYFSHCTPTQAAITCPQSILASSLGDEAVSVQNTCVTSIMGPLSSNTVNTGVPPTVKQWKIPSSFKDNATLRLSCGMEVCVNVMTLLIAMVVPLLFVPALVAAIQTLPAQSLATLTGFTGFCNSPVYKSVYHISSFDMRQLTAGTKAWCKTQTEYCSTINFLSEMSRRGYEQADPAKRISTPHDSFAIFHDDVHDEVLARCITNALHVEGCPEVWLLLSNATAGVMPPCATDVLVECTQQEIVTALDWVPTSNVLPLLTCVRLFAKGIVRQYSWRRPGNSLQLCVRLMLAYLTLWVVYIFMAMLCKKLLVGRFRSGSWDVMDVRSNEWMRNGGGYVLSRMMFADETLSKALSGSRWQLILYRFYGMRVGKRVFVDRDVCLMGARR